MMRKFLTIALLSAGALAFAAEPAPTAKSGGMVGKDGKKLSGEEVRAILYKYNGGKLKYTAEQKGVIHYVNCNNAVKAKWLKQNADFFADLVMIDVRVSDGVFSLPSPKLVGDASLFVIDDPSMPSILLAPEQKWVMVNVAPLKAGRGEKEAFFAARVQKELTRAFAMLCGATSSNYPDSLTACVTDVDSLDKFADCQLPNDVIARFASYLKGYGITPYQMKTYRKACQEGWAQPPTNDVQKAIWDQVNTIPADPIKIKFDPKKGK